MTFAKFSITVLVLYFLYYGFLILIERLKTKQVNPSHLSRNVHFVIEQPQNVLSHHQQTPLASGVGENKSSSASNTSIKEEEGKNILQDLGIEAYYSSSIGITEDNLLTLSNHEIH